MLWIRALLPLLTCAATAAAHGGGMFPDPPPPVRGIPCDCARVECARCGSERLRTGERITRTVERTILRRWDDVWRCRFRIVCTTKVRSTEAFVQLEPAPLFAAVSATIALDGAELRGTLTDAEPARRSYLFERRSFERDPLLAIRRGAGRVDVRFFPVGPSAPAVATIDGYMLAPVSRRAAGVRLYRTGERVLAVVPSTSGEGAVFFDAGGGRALFFLTRDECRTRFGRDDAVEVPFVDALETAATGRGDAAAGESKVVAALALDSRQPPFIGPDWRTVTPGMVEPPPQPPE
jgi:hypothetical protein